MPASAAIRLQVETALAKRVPAALTLKIKQAPELFSTGICGSRCRPGRRHSAREHHRGCGRGIDGQDILCAFVHRRHHAVRRGLRVGRCERCALAGIRSGGEHRFEAAAMAPHVGRAQTACHRQTVVAAGAGIEGNGFVASGRRLRGHRARYERCAARSRRCAFRWRRGIAFGSPPSRPARHLSFSRNRHAPAVARRLLCAANLPAFNPSAATAKRPSSRDSNTRWSARANRNEGSAIAS